MIALNEIIKSFDKFTRILLSMCILFFLIMLIQQISLINIPYEKYRISVTDSFIDTIRFGFFTITIGVISFKYLKKWVEQ